MVYRYTIPKLVTGYCLWLLLQHMHSMYVHVGMLIVVCTAAVIVQLSPSPHAHTQHCMQFFQGWHLSVVHYLRTLRYQLSLSLNESEVLLTTTHLSSLCMYNHY